MRPTLFVFLDVVTQTVVCLKDCFLTRDESAEVNQQVNRLAGLALESKITDEEMVRLVAHVEKAYFGGDRRVPGRTAVLYALDMLFAVQAELRRRQCLQRSHVLLLDMIARVEFEMRNCRTPADADINTYILPLADFARDLGLTPADVEIAVAPFRRLCCAWHEQDEAQKPLVRWTSYVLGRLHGALS